ncbi:MAG: DUF4416 family protein [Planctomycetota bacterium]
MGHARPAEPARLVVGALSAFPEAWSRARAALVERFGPVELEAGPLPFRFTDYYAEEMGPDLQRWFAAFARPVGQHEIAGIKHETGAVESELAGTGNWPVRRPVNLDPGYVTLGKLVLATTKDQAHRVAVGADMYAEVTLRWAGGKFVPNEWTYADYRQESCLEFFAAVRKKLADDMGPG